MIHHETAREIFEELDKFPCHSDIDGVTLNLEEIEEYKEIKEKYLHSPQTKQGLVPSGHSSASIMGGKSPLNQLDKTADTNQSVQYDVQESSKGVQYTVHNHNRAADSSELCVNNSRSSVPDAILFYAFRYALGRMTYAVSDVSREIINRWNTLHSHTQDLIIKEIKQAIEDKKAGWDCDIAEWQKILDLKKETGA